MNIIRKNHEVRPGDPKPRHIPLNRLSVWDSVLNHVNHKKRNKKEEK